MKFALIESMASSSEANIALIIHDVESGALLVRKAALFYNVLRLTLNRRLNSALPEKEGYYKA
jgi:hypothetical protein